MSDLIYENETYAIRGACFEVYNVMGNGFLKNVYQECLSHEFSERGIPFAAHPTVGLMYKNRKLGKTFIPDFICYGSIIVEIKAVCSLIEEHTSQVLSYLHATGFTLGLLVNFGHFPGVESKRIVL